MMKYPKTYKDINTGRQKLDEWLKINYIDFYNYIIKIYSSDIKEALYMFYNHIDKRPVCKICGKPVKFFGYSKGFGVYCCAKCAQNDPDVRQKFNKTCIYKFGEDFKLKFIKKGKETKKSLYGDSKYNNTDKAKLTNLERYGVDNCMKINVFKEKSKKTCLEKYGKEYYFKSESFNNKRKKFLEKSKKTCLEKYGYEFAIQNNDVKQKISETCLEKYGVMWNCMRDEAHNSHNFNSGPNENFAQLLDKYNIKYDREFCVNDKIFDFKINNILIEINPWPTHNSNWNPYKNSGIDINYHHNKTLLGVNKGFRVINIWDWDEPEKIVKSLIIKEKIYARNCIVKEVNKKDTYKFISEYHLQGNCRGQKILLGLYYNNQLIQIMTFGKPRYNKNYQYELLRLCTKFNYIILGGSEKLFAYFIKNYNPDSIISYCDNSKFLGGIYKKLGFKLKINSLPSIHWYNGKTKQHITDNLLRQRGVNQLFGVNYDKNTNNETIIKSMGFVQIYDSGQSTWIYKK